MTMQLNKNKNNNKIKIITGHNSPPKKSEPNCIIDHKNIDGIVDIRAFYNEEGLKKLEINTTNHNRPKYHKFGKHGEHAHDYVWNENGEIVERTVRELSDKERKDNDDIL